MKRNILLLVLLIAFTGTIFGQKKEEKAVRKAFEGYKNAILNDKGGEAVDYVDSRTISYYDKMLNLVKNADSSEVANLSLLDKLMVLTIRHRTSRENIYRFDGKSMLIYAIQKGMVGKSSVAGAEIGDVKVNENFATGKFIVNKQETPMDFHFYKEDGSWKIDLTSIFTFSNMALKKSIGGMEMGEDEFIMYALEMTTGTKPETSIWDPVK